MANTAVVRKSVKMVGFDYANGFKQFEGLMKSLAYKAYVKIQHVSMIELDDLIADGHIYMLQISEKFDRTKGVKFSTFMTDSLQKFFINAVKYHYRECRKGNMNTYDIDEYVPNVDKDYELIYEMTEEGIDEDTRYEQLIGKVSSYIEERDMKVYELMTLGLPRKEIMEQLDMKPWTYNKARIRIQNAIAPLVGRETI
jgi:hypothetical protein